MPRIHFDSASVILFMIAGLSAFSRYDSYDTDIRLFMTVATIGILISSLLVHEGGHIFVAARYGMPCKNIVIMAFGAAAEVDEPTTAGQEFKIAIAGPLVSFTIAAVTYLASETTTGAVADLLRSAFVTNLTLGAFNLLMPIFPMDGGRILRSIIWAWHRCPRWYASERAVTFAGWCSTGVITGAIMCAALSQNPGYLWLAVLAFFMMKTNQRVMEREYEECATFNECSLQRSTFVGAKFTSMIFHDCNLRGADFTGADLRMTRFVDCDMTGTVMKDADTRGMKLIGCTSV